MSKHMLHASYGILYIIYLNKKSVDAVADDFACAAYPG